MYSIIYSKRAVKSLYKHDRILKSAIEKWIYDFLKLGKNNNVKRLRWYENRYRLRIWKYRVLFEKYEDKLIILVIDIWSRWDIYK